MLLRGPTENPRASVANTLIERAAQTLFEAKCPPDEGEPDHNSQAYADHLDPSYTNDGERRLGPATSIPNRSRKRSTEMAA